MFCRSIEVCVETYEFTTRMYCLVYCPYYLHCNLEYPHLLLAGDLKNHQQNQYPPRPKCFSGGALVAMPDGEPVSVEKSSGAATVFSCPTVTISERGFAIFAVHNAKLVCCICVRTLFYIVTYLPAASSRVDSISIIFI